MNRSGAKNPYRGGSIRILPDIKCETCRIFFRQETKSQKFCSHQCAREGRSLDCIFKVFERISIDDLTGCWNWTGRLNIGGYPISGLRLISSVAHRVIYFLLRGEIASTYQIDHLCRNRKCVNPDHLEAVLPVINVRRGLSSVLSDDDISAIKGYYGDGYTQTWIAQKFNINQGHVSKIIHEHRRVTI